MGIIKKNLQMSGSKNGRICEVILDSGASACFVRENVAKELSQILKAPVTLAFKLGDASLIKAEYTTDLYVNIKGHNLAHMFLVVPKLAYEVIIGADFLQRWKIKLDPTTEDFIIDEKALEIVLIVLN
ncbi:MAG TPA: retroviral-like aspartic protease [bacterium (Candidatus Stahlbacteria)]|nr:retroviral-like aspartic protease [Candidatus Stahlbacteria bacterium]